MKLTVCFKVIKELEKVLPSDWQSFDLKPDTSYVGTIIGCYDEAALETALKLKDSDPCIELTALTFGLLPNNHARRIFAAGFQNVVCLKSDNTEFSPRESAARLAVWLEENPQDLIICGSRTALNDSGSVPYYLASELKLPIVPDVLSAAENEKGLSLRHRAAGILCESEIKLPALIIAGSSTEPLRLTSLMAQIQAKKKEPLIIETEGVSEGKMKLLGRRESECEYMKLSPPDAARWLTGLIKEAEE